MTRRPICLVCLILMLGLCAADLAGFPLIRGNPLPEKVQKYIEEHPDAVIIGEVQQCQATEFSFSVYLKNVFLTVQSEKIPIKNIRVFLKKEEELPAGTLAAVEGKLERVGEPRNPGEFDSQQHYACRHIYYFLKEGRVKGRSKPDSGYRQWLLDFREKLRGILRDCAGEDAPVFEAMLLGEKENLEPEQKLKYQMAGIMHILSISGLHISILGMGLFSLLKKISLGNGTAGLLSLCLMLQYGIMTGGSVSAMRALCMFVLAVGAKILGRIYDLLTAVALSAILLLLDSPAYLYSSSFLLSFGALAGIAVLYPCLVKLTGIRGKAGKSLISSLAVQAASLPVMLVFFGEVSLAGLVLNLAVLPTVGGVLASGVFCSVLGVVNRELGRMAALPGRALLGFYDQGCMLAARLPFCTWIGGCPEVWQRAVYYGFMAAGTAAGLALAKKTRQKKPKGWRRMAWRALPGAVSGIFLAFGILILSWRQEDGLRITCLDIGQGDGIVLEVPEGGVFLMDCGSSSKKQTALYQLLPYLKSRGISFIDGIMVSHTDQDHISGILELMEYMARNLTSLKAGTLILPAWEKPPEAYERLKKAARASGMEVAAVEAGKRLLYGQTEFRILAPPEGAKGEEANREGMVMELSYGDFRGLFTGDIGSDREKELLPFLEDVDFLKIAHHGSRHSTCQEFLNRVRPEAAVISCSDTNTYGHPSPETTLRLKKNGVKVEYTMKNGAITVGTDGKTLWTERFLE